MAEKEIARQRVAASGIEFKPSTRHSNSEFISRKGHVIGALIWREDEIAVHWAMKPGQNKSTLGELEDIVDEMHRVKTALNPNSDDMSFADRSMSDIVKPGE